MTTSRQQQQKRLRQCRSIYSSCCSTTLLMMMAVSLFQSLHVVVDAASSTTSGPPAATRVPPPPPPPRRQHEQAVVAAAAVEESRKNTLGTTKGRNDAGGHEDDSQKDAAAHAHSILSTARSTPPPPPPRNSSKEKHTAIDTTEDATAARVTALQDQEQQDETALLSTGTYSPWDNKDEQVQQRPAAVVDAAAAATTTWDSADTVASGNDDATSTRIPRPPPPLQTDDLTAAIKQSTTSKASLGDGNVYSRSRPALSPSSTGDEAVERKAMPTRPNLSAPPAATLDTSPRGEYMAQGTSPQQQQDTHGAQGVSSMNPPLRREQQQQQQLGDAARPRVAPLIQQQPPLQQRSFAPLQPQQPVALLSSSSPKPVWERLWKRVETSLDTLAELEDELQGRARKLYATTMVRGKTGRTIQLPQSRTPTAVDIGAVQKNRYEQAVPAKSSSAAFPDKNVATDSMRNDDGGIGQQATIATTGTVVSPARRLMIANGGSSAPPDTRPHRTPLQPIQATRPVLQNEPPPQQTKASPFVAARNAQQQQYQADSQAPNIQSQEATAATIHQDGTTPSSAVSSSASRPAGRYSFDDDDNVAHSGFSRLAKMMPSIPRLRLPRLFRQGGSFRRDDALAALDLWEADDEHDRPIRLASRLFGWMKMDKPDDGHLTVTPRITKTKEKSEYVMPQLLRDLMKRCQDGHSTALLTKENRRKGGSIGRKLAVIDAIALGAILVAVRELRVSEIVLPASLGQLVSDTLPALFSTLVASTDGWMPIALAVIYLSFKTVELVHATSVVNLFDEVSKSISSEARTGSLFLRIYTGEPIDQQMTSRLQYAAKAQIEEKVSMARLRFFIFSLLATLVAMTASVLRPLFQETVHFLAHIFILDELRSWPVPWRSLGLSLKMTSIEYATAVLSLMRHSFKIISDDPVRVAYEMSVFVVLALALYLPQFENSRAPKPVSCGDEEEIEATQLHARLTESLENFGSSSGIRLGALSEMNAIESILERWRLMLPQEGELSSALSMSSVLRIIVYKILSGVLLFAPVVAFAFAGVSLLGPAIQPPMRWDSLLDVSVILLFTHYLVQNALSGAVIAKESEGYIAPFVSRLGKAYTSRLTEMETQQCLELQSSLISTAGLAVKDLWAAHTTRRAWAVRGATIEARSSEIVALFGDPGSGKSRLLTTLAEALTDPPRAALSTTRVRGSVLCCGVETNKWDKTQMRRRVGLLLNDGQTLPAMSKAFSGLSIEEILEPSSLHRSPESSRNAMVLGLKLTGLYTSLIPRLPNKLGSIVTAIEEDLRPSTLRPRAVWLSPVEWSKLLLARVLAQTIYDNDNAFSSDNTVDKCLVGSVLLLDEATAYFSEVDEARLIRELRRTGAAIIMASNRWATGRFADRIAVLKDGALMESGSHNTLLGRGPEYSTYAAQWNAMATT